MVLSSTDTKREIYLPASANVPLDGAALQLDANYLRANGGRTTMIVSLDNYPVSAPGNILRIEPTSRFTYRYNGAAIRDLAAAWGALPATAVIPVAGGSLSADSYDTAWRLGVALADGGKHKMKDAAEIGALMSLGQSGPFRADVIVADKALIASMAAAFAARRWKKSGRSCRRMTATGCICLKGRIM
jgi:hypothetical protein